MKQVYKFLKRATAGQQVSCRAKKANIPLPYQPLTGWAILIICLSSTLPSLAQGPAPSSVPVVIPPAPTAAALERYGQIPVSTYTGVPNISVPLYEIKVRDLAIPLSLSYHAAGFRVNEEASWVGLGWSLQAGGVLTHTTRGLDDLRYFIPQNGHPPYGMPDCVPANGGDNFIGDPYSGAATLVNAAGGAYTGPDIKTYVKDASGQDVGLPYARDGVYENRQIDWEPDEYRFTMGNASGAFAFDQQGNIHLLEQQKVRVSYTYETPTGNVAWTIRTPDGFQYRFEASEQTSSFGNSTISAWYLTRILSPLGEQASFIYERGPGIYNQPGFTQTEIKQQSVQHAATPLTTTYSAGGTVPQYLKRIEFKTGYVTFERDACNRKDLQGGQRLRRVAIYTLDNQMLKQYELQSSYFETPNNLLTGYLTSESGGSAAIDSFKVYEGKRLRLDAVREGGQQALTKPLTTFTYSATPLPVKSSYSVDYWGYYNGRANTSLIPTYAGPDLSNKYVVYQGADRTPSAGPMQADILQAITYPTGGKTTFTFEPHEYGNSTVEDDQSVKTGLSFRLQSDNVNANSSYATNATIRVTASTPITLDYTLGVETGGNLDDKKARTTLQLIDSTTQKPFTSGSPDLNNYVYAQWGFFSTTSTPSNPYSIPNWAQVTGHIVILVPAGTYKFTAYTPNCNSSDIGACHATVYVQGTYSVTQHVQNTTTNKLLAGGLRVKQIEEFDNLDPARNQVQVFNYGSETTSSTGQVVAAGDGILLSRPVFSKIVTYYFGNDKYYQHQLTSFSQTALSVGAKGSSVGYSQVSVLQGAQGEGGKTVYAYYCQPDRAARYSDRQPNVPTRADELNGSLLSQATYKKQNSAFKLVSQLANKYESVQDSRYHYDLPAVFKGEYFTNADGTGTNIQRLYFYSLPVNWVRLVSAAKTQYGDQDETKFFTTNTRYTYDTLNVGHMQVSQTRTRRSDGSTLVTTSTYPADYTAVTSGALFTMRSDTVYQHAAVVETSKCVYGPTETLAAAKIVAGSYTEYTRPNGKSRFLPAVSSKLELATPLTYPSSAAPSLPPNGRYVREQRIAYETTAANVQQEQKEHGLPVLFIWGYANTLPVAKIDNATLAQVQAALGVDVNTLTTEQQLRDAFSHLRQQLPKAHVTSFTHQPLIGMTSQTNPDGRTFFYEYDGLQRLVRTRDEQGRILSQQQYHYAGK